MREKFSELFRELVSRSLFSLFFTQSPQTIASKAELIRDFYEFLARRQSETSTIMKKKTMKMMRNKNKERLLKSLIRADLMAFVCGAVQSSFYIIKLLLLFTKTNTLNGETCGQPSTVYFRY